MSDKSNAHCRSVGSGGLMCFLRAASDRRPLGTWRPSVLSAILTLCLILSVLWGRVAPRIAEAQTLPRAEGVPTVNPRPHDPPVDWQLYTDAENGYSIRYPPAWDIQRPSAGPEYGVRVDFLPVVARVPAEVTVALSVVAYDNPEGLTAEQWVQRELGSFPTQVASSVVTETCQVGGRPGVQAVGMPSRLGTLEIFLPGGWRMYRFIVTPYQPAQPSLAHVLPEISMLMDLSVPSFRLLAP